MCAAISVGIQSGSCASCCATTVCFEAPRCESAMANPTRDNSKEFGCIDVQYGSGKPALYINRDNSGFAYYESGRVAVCVSSLINGYQVKSFFYADDKAKTLIGTIDENVCGFAYDFTGDEEKYAKGNQFRGRKLLMTGAGCMYTDSNGTITKEWKWNPKAQGAGTPPEKPIEFNMNDQLRFKFIDRKRIIVYFRVPSEGLQYAFDCGEKLRRSKTYIDNGRYSKIVKGKIELTVQTPSLIERFDEEERLNRLSKSNVSSKDITDPEIAAAMKAQELITEEYKDRIVNHKYVHPYMDGKWRTDSVNMTVREVPRITETGQEIGPKPEDPASGIYCLGSTTRAVGDPTKTMGKTMSKTVAEEGELETSMRLSRENPKLPRPFVLRAASGRYSRDMPVEVELDISVPLEVVTPSTFDSYIGELAGPDQLCVVLCSRADTQEHVWAEQLFKYVLGAVVTAGSKPGKRVRQETDLSKVLYRVGKFDMAQSRLMVKRYNVKTLPCYLAFYNKKLVSCRALGSKAIALTKSDDNPRTLLFEPNFADQIKTEKILKKLRYEWDLCLTAAAGVSRAKSLADSGAHLGADRQDEYAFSLVLVNNEMVSAEEVRTVKSFISRTGGSGPNKAGPLFCSMVKMGTVPLAKLPLDLTRKPEEQGYKAPVACPRTGVVLGAGPEHLCHDTCTVAVVKDIRRGTLDEMSTKVQTIKQTAMDAMVAARSKADGTTAPREEVDGRHMGHTKTDLLQEFAEALAMGRRGQFQDKDFKYGLRLTMSRANFRGQVLGEKING